MRKQLRFPSSGVDTSGPYGEQPGLTTREGLGVRNRDPISKRRRGAQRPGLEDYVDEDLSGAGSKVQALAQTMRPRSLKTWTAWDGTGDAPLEWGEISPGEEVAYDGDTDSQGNLWVVDGAGILAKYNSAGKRLEEISLPFQSVEEIVRRVRVDELDAVYVAAARRVGTLAGRVIRYVRADEDDEGYEMAWQLVVDGAVMDFDVRGGALRVVTEYEGDGGELYAKLLGYGNVFGYEPQLEHETQVPRPVHGVVLNSKGEPITSHPKNPGRGTVPGGEGFTQRGEGWSPHLLPNADQRIYAWGSARTIFGVADGTRIEEWQDIRDLAYEQALGYDRIKDLEPRNMFRSKEDADGDPFRRAPVFQPKGMGEGAALRFDGDAETPGKTVYDADDVIRGVMLQSRWNVGNDPKTNADDSLDKSRALLPAYKNAKYSLHLVVRLDRLEEPGVLLAHNAKTPVGIVVNSGEQALADPAHASAAKQGYLGVFMNGKDSGGSATVTGGTSIKEARWDQYTTNAGDFDNESNAVLISLCSNGGDGASWYLRVNGKAIDKWQVDEDPSSHLGPKDPYTVLGSAYRRPVLESGELFADAFSTYKWASLYGAVSDYVVVLADSSADTAPHDQAIDVPDIASGFSGSIDQTSAAADWTTATEVEVIEGWLAGVNGISHILPNGYLNGTKTGAFWHNHPFGGVGNWPIDAGYSGIVVPRDTRNLFSPDPILAKWSPSGVLRYAFTGPGVGYAAAVDADDDVLTIGEFVDDGTGSVPIVRKFIDKGNHYETNEPYEATVELTALPVVGDYVEIDDDGAGANPTVRFEFYTGVPGIDTATLKHVKSEINTATTLFNLQVAIFNAKGAGHTEVSTSLDFPRLNLFRSDVEPAAMATLGPIVATSWSGGSNSSEAWQFPGTSADAPSYEFPRLLVDTDGDLYVPVSTPTRSNHVDRYDGAGNGDGTTDRVWRLTIDLADVSGQVQTFAIAADPTVPDYGDDPVTGPRYLYVLSDATTDEANIGDLPTIRKYELASDTPSGEASARDHHTIAVAGGDVRRIQRGQSSTLIASGAFDTSARIDAVALNSQVYLFDGYKPRVYMPKEGVLREFVATTGGEVPREASIAVAWNGRLVVAGDPSAPDNVSMSARTDPYDWDFGRRYGENAPAFEFADSRVGLVPDVVTALVPLADDLLLVGCDHTTFRLTGDPRLPNTQLDLISEVVGIAPGRSVAKDDTDAAYIFEMRGGVVRVGAGGGFDRISLPIESELRNINLTQYRVELAWDDFREALEVLQVPIGAGGEIVRKWVWERREAAWFYDEASAADVQATATLVVDGDDPADRLVLYGCEDGRVRYTSDTAADDAGYAILSSVLLAPALGSETDQEWRFSQLGAVLASEQDGVRYEMFAAEDPEALGSVMAAGEFGPGRNPRHSRARARGSDVWVRLVNERLGRRWAMESVHVAVNPAGRKKVRS